MIAKITQLIGLKKPYNFFRLIIFIFVCSRLVIYHFVPYIIESGTDMHFLDQEILKTNLLHGLYYLHAQPPLFNLFLGILLKLNPYISIHILAQSIYFCLGLFLSLGSFYLIKILGGKPRLAFVGALVVMFFPPLIQSERWLEFFYPMTALMLCASLVVYFFVLTRQIKYFFYFFLIMTIMALTFGFYHLIFWLLPLMALAGLLIFKLNLPQKKYYFLIMACCFILSSTIYIKNYAQYGMFTSSTWQGFNVNGSTHYVKQTEIQSLVDRKVITPLALIPRLSKPELYYNYYRVSPKAGDNTIDSLYKSSGSVNFNNWIYPEASKEVQKNTFKILLRYPGRYLLSVANEVYVFFGFFQYREFDNFHNWGSVRVRTGLDKMLLNITAYPLPLTMFILFALGLYWLVCKIKAAKNFLQSETDKQATGVLQLFILFAVIYTLAFGTMIDAGEANFLRVPIDPLFLSLALLSLSGPLTRLFNFLGLEKN